MQNFIFITSQYLLNTNILSSYPEIFCCNIADQENHHLKNAKLETVIEKVATEKNAKYYGIINFCSAFQLSRRILDEKTRIILRRTNIVHHPVVAINTILNDWQQKNNIQSLLTYAENFVHKTDHINIEKRIPQNCLIDSCYHQLLSLLSTSFDKEKHKLFLLAVAYWQSLELLDLLTSTQHFSYERLLNDQTYYADFISYLTRNSCNEQQVVNKNLIADIKNPSAQNSLINWLPWQKELLDKIIINDKALYKHYQNLGCGIDSQPIINLKNEELPPLISIQLNSNRPAQISFLFDNLEESADDPSCIEVLVNIDDGDVVMEKMLEQERKHRKFIIKYISSPKPKSFCDLWQPLNKLLAIAHPKAYFLLNISDEMYFKTQGWDSILKKYVGFFPDHIFRLRASRNKYRNYFDFWECGFAQDSIAITTKKWVDIGGDWNPCFGPDSFQQFVAFYLVKYDHFFAESTYYRDIPINDIEFGGDIPFLGIDEDTARKHVSDHLKAWFISASYKMQLEASRRAALLRCHIAAHVKKLNHFKIVEFPNKKMIRLIDDETGKNVAAFNYKISWLMLNIKNHSRKLFFNYFFGLGRELNLIYAFIGYLKIFYLGKYAHKLQILFRKLAQKFTSIKYIAD